MIPLDRLYYGVVEDVNDPMFFGRVRVRIFGVHTEDRNALPTDFLPWADLALPATNAAISGVGLAPVGLVKGSGVWCVPKEPSDMQEWLVLFSAGGMRTQFRNSQFGFNDPDGEYPRPETNHDVNVLARGNVKSSEVLGDKESNKSSADIDSSTQPAPAPLDPNAYKDAPWMQVALSQLGINEKDNPDKIKEYHSLGGGSSKWGGETPWCASFVGYCFKKAGVKGSGLASARSYLNYGQDISQEPKYGAVVVMRGTRGPSSGHVFFFMRDLGDKIEGIGGNQSYDSTKNVKYDNGGQVTRSIFPKSKILGYRYPTSANKA